MEVERGEATRQIDFVFACRGRDISRDSVAEQFAWKVLFGFANWFVPASVDKVVSLH
jgi:hypothetical protein